MRTDLARLACPDAFPDPRPHRVEVRETHASIVFLGERDVYKVKKPVDLGFLDFRTVEKRKVACEAEVALNARLAPDVYLGVVPVVRAARRDGALAFGGDGALVDWAVHMRRLPDDERADVLLARGALTAETVDAVAERLAAFHAAARCDDETRRFGAPDVVARNVVENFAQTRESIGAHLRPGEADEIETRQLGFLRDARALFERRAAEGRVRDGHGDLRLEHVYVDPGGALTVLDCIEFNERFRFADVASDVAFLAMDLAWHRRVDLAERLLARYALASGDYDLYAVVDFYEGYRAYVRGKVATMLAADHGAPDDARRAAAAEARRYFLLALASQRRALLPPVVVCVGGVIASGKSTVAAAVAGELGAPVVEADRTRKQLLGVDPRTRIDDAAWSGAYDVAFTERVYAEVLRRAEAVVASGRAVVLDASFRSPAQRAAARAFAAARGVPIRFVECVAPPDVCRRRLAQREVEGGVSDGRLAIFDAFVARFEPFDELPPDERLVVDTSGEAARAVARVREVVATWPRGFVV
jgi:aminoglycoside phosphotransferase family enzyme/predicted kinase